jgi:hypothetical protein
MAQAKRKRSRKHRGTQAGTIEARGRTGRRPATQVEARKISRDRRAERFAKPPTWRSAFNRAAISAAVFAVAIVLLFHRPVSAAVVLGVAMILIYLPMSYFTDRFLYNRRQRRKGAGVAR